MKPVTNLDQWKQVEVKGSKRDFAFNGVKMIVAGELSCLMNASQPTPIFVERTDEQGEFSDPVFVGTVMPGGPQVIKYVADRTCCLVAAIPANAVFAWLDAREALTIPAVEPDSFTRLDKIGMLQVSEEDAMMYRASVLRQLDRMSDESRAERRAQERLTQRLNDIDAKLERLAELEAQYGTQDLDNDAAGDGGEPEGEPQ